MVPNRPVPKDPDTRLTLKVDVGNMTFEEVEQLLQMWKERITKTHVISGRYFHGTKF